MNTFLAAFYVFWRVGRGGLGCINISFTIGDVGAESETLAYCCLTISDGSLVISALWYPFCLAPILLKLS